MIRPQPNSPEIPVVAPYAGEATRGTRRRAPRGASGYHSPRGWGNWLIATAASGIALSLLSNFLDYRVADAAEWSVATNRAAVTGSAFHDLLAQVLIASRCVHGLSLLGGILLLCWFYRVVANLPRLNAQDSRFSPGWAVAFFFIPFANLLYPFNILKEVWRGSDPDRALGDGYSWKRNPATPLLGVWWAAHLVTLLLGIVAVAVASESSHHTLADWAATYRFLASVRYVDMLNHGLVIALVVSLDRRQDARRRRLQEILATYRESAPEEIPSPSPTLPVAVSVVVLVGMALAIGVPAPVDSPTAASGWRNFAAPDGRFTIDMPGPPVEPDRFASSERVHCYTYQSDTTEFTVVEITLGEDAPLPSGDTLTARLKDAAHGFLAKEGDTITEITTVAKPGGLSGIEAAFTRDNGNRKGTARFFLKDKTLYEVLVAEGSEEDDGTTAQRFENSFHLR